jgi:hypothetical protein
VTPIPATDGCASFPGYTSDKEPTDPFIVEAVNNGSPVEGHGLTYVQFQPQKYHGSIGRVRLLNPLEKEYSNIKIPLSRSSSQPTTKSPRSPSAATQPTTP